MPARKVSIGGGRYRVITPNRTHAKSTTARKANAQIRLLNAVEHRWKPGKGKRSRKRADKDFGDQY